MIKSILIPFILAIAAYFLGMNLAKADDVIPLIVAEARKQGVDPLLAVAVATVESSLRQTAVGPVGEIGLFQLRPEYHGEDVKELHQNVYKGIRYLKQLQTTCPVKEFVICFNQGTKRKPRFPLKHPYFRKVMLAREKMELAHLSY